MKPFRTNITALPKRMQQITGEVSDLFDDLSANDVQFGDEIYTIIEDRIDHIDTLGSVVFQPISKLDIVKRNYYDTLNERLRRKSSIDFDSIPATYERANTLSSQMFDAIVQSGSQPETMSIS